MLCPVCNLKPLEGRRTTCGTKCRSAKHRAKKRRERDASQPNGTRDAGIRGAQNYPSSQQGGDAPTRLEQLVSIAFDRIVQAIERQGTQSTQQRREAQRVDMREQVTSQAPKRAVGYRLALPGPCAGAPPKLVPKRGRTREVPWYSLQPFEYPDDIRLIDGYWHRLVWIDEQGQRIPHRKGEPIPSLFFFLGPPCSGSSPERQPAMTEQPQARGEQSLSPAAAGALDARPRQEQAGSDTPTVLLPSDTSAAASEPAIIGPPLPSLNIVEPVAAAPTPANLQTKVPAESGVSAEVAETFFRLVGKFPPMTPGEWTLLYAFVLQVPWMIYLSHDAHRRQALASSLPPPQAPILNLSTKNRDIIERLLGTAPSHFFPLCQSVFAFLKANGTEVLQLAPVPFHPLSSEQQQPILQALRDPKQKAYLEYICLWQEALLNGQKVPEEPSVKLTSERRRELRRLLFDLRAVMFFRQRAAVSSSGHHVTAVPA